MRILLVAIVLGGALASQAHARDIDVRIHVKYILNASNARPPGHYGNPANLYDVIDKTNLLLARFGRGYRYVIVGVVDVPGKSQFFDLADGAEMSLLETQAEADTGAFHWTLSAINLYVVNSFSSGGAAAIPSQDPGREIVVMTPAPSPLEIIWPHELGHHFDLIHTFGEDGVSDTRPDPDPNQCTTLFGCGLGGALECCCATKIANLDAAATAGGWTTQERDDLYYNLMSYYGATDCVPQHTFDNIRLTSGQLDRWTDASRFFFPGQVSGLTRFVDSQLGSVFGNGYSGAPHGTPYFFLSQGVSAASPSGGDIVMLRAGTYLENLTIDKPLTLRASRGVARVGN